MVYYLKTIDLVSNFAVFQIFLAKINPRNTRYLIPSVHIMFEWHTDDYSRKVIQTKFFGALVRNFYLRKVSFKSRDTYKKSRKIPVPKSLFLTKLQASGLQFY